MTWTAASSSFSSETWAASAWAGMAAVRGISVRYQPVGIVSSGFLHSQRPAPQAAVWASFRRHGREPGDRVDVARGSVARGRDPELRAADPVRVVDIDFARPEPDLLVRLPLNLAERVGGRGAVEEDGDRPARRLVGERVAGEDHGHLGGAPHNDPDRLAHVRLKLRLERDPRLRLGAVPLGDHIAARDSGPNLPEPGPLAQAPEVGHLELAGPADIDRAQQEDEDGHGGHLDS